MQPREQDQWSTKDVTRLLALVEAERRYYQEVVAALPVPVAVVGHDMEFASANRAFRQLFGMKLNGVLDGLLERTVIAPGIEALAARALETGEAQSEDFPATLTAAGLRNLRITVQPVREWQEPGGDDLVIVVDASPAAALEAGTMAGVRVWRAGLPGLTIAHSEGANPGGLDPAVWAPGAELVSRAWAGDASAVAGFYQALAGGEELRHIDYRAKGSSQTWLRDTVSVERDEAGVAVAVHGLTSDITSLRQREESARQATRLNSLSRMASLVAHDCNNLLMILSGYGEELLHALEPSDPLRSNIQEILYAGDRLSVLTNQLTEYARIAPMSVEPVGIDEWIEGQQSRWRQDVSRPVDIRVRTRAAGSVVEVDVAALTAIMHTLVQRAADSMTNGGAIEIETTAYVRDSVVTGKDDVIGAGRYVRVTVRDNGLAIHPESLGRLFEPDLSGTPPRHNLARVYQTIREMRGDISATSTYEGGTVFTLLLPLRAAEAGVPAVPEDAPAPEPARRSVLVVEDERRIRELIAKTLVRAGFDVIEAGEGREAIEAMDRLGRPVDLLLTDVVMPQMSGVELASSLQGRNPNLKVVFVSGYPGLSGSELPAGSSFLQKPFTLQSLVAKIREALGVAKAAGA